MSDKIRRSLGWLVSVVLGVWATDYVLYRPQLRHDVLRWNAIGVLVLALAAITALVWALRKATWYKTLTAIILAVLVTMWWHSVFHGRVGWLALALLIGIVLWAITVMEKQFFSPFAVVVRKGYDAAHTAVKDRPVPAESPTTEAVIASTS